MIDPIHNLQAAGIQNARTNNATMDPPKIGNVKGKPVETTQTKGNVSNLISRFEQNPKFVNNLKTSNVTYSEKTKGILKNNSDTSNQKEEVVYSNAGLSTISKPEAANDNIIGKLSGNDEYEFLDAWLSQNDFPESLDASKKTEMKDDNWYASNVPLVPEKTADSFKEIFDISTDQIYNTIDSSEEKITTDASLSLKNQKLPPLPDAVPRTEMNNSTNEYDTKPLPETPKSRGIVSSVTNFFSSKFAYITDVFSSLRNWFR